MNKNQDMSLLEEYEEVEVINTGWKLVPLEPTYKMVNDSDATDPPEFNGPFIDADSMRYIYQRMIEIAPEAPVCKHPQQVLTQAMQFVKNNDGRGKELVENLLAIIYDLQQREANS
jgi:hypothetical protein